MPGLAGVPGLSVSWPGLEQSQKPPAQHFLKAFHFLFCLCSKVLYCFAKLPAFSVGMRTEASRLPSHMEMFLHHADGGYTQNGVTLGFCMAVAASTDRYTAGTWTRMGTG